MVFKCYTDEYFVDCQGFARAVRFENGNFR